jgi:hypothetical protein
MAKQEVAVSIQALKIAKTEVKIAGDLLIIHKFSEKSRKEMLGKQMGAAKKIRENRVPDEEVEQALYRCNGKPAFPADGFKKAIVNACRYASGLPMTRARGMFFVRGVYASEEGRELIPIEGKLEKREDIGRLENGVACVIFRPQLRDWTAVLPIEYNADLLSLEQLINLINIAGAMVGVGDWRPERGGTFGRFRVVLEERKAKK